VEEVPHLFEDYWYPESKTTSINPFNSEEIDRNP